MVSSRRGTLAHVVQQLVLLVLLVLLVALVAPATAHAAADAEVDRLLDQARRQKAALQYQQALDTLDGTLRLGRSGPAELIAIFRQAGELAAGLDDEAAATAHFERLLALAPDATLPDGTSPKLTAPFEAARARLAAHGPLRVRFEPTATTTSGQRAPTLVMIVEADPLAMVAGARAHIRTPDGAETSVSARGATRAVLALPSGVSLQIVASAVDEFGNELVVHGTWQVPLVVPAADSGSSGGGTPGRHRARPSFFARWPLWGAVGVAFGAAGLYFGLEVRDAQADYDALVADSMNHSYDELVAVQDRGDRAALLANLGFVAAGAATVVAAILLIRELRTDDDGPILMPAPTPGGDGATLLLDCRF